MNIRKELAQQIAGHADFPAAWKVFPYAIVPETFTHPVISVRQQSAQRTPGAPRAFRDIGFALALMEPHEDVERVEDALDEDLELLIDILEDLPMPGLIWTGARRLVFEEQAHGYEITLTITTTKE